MTKVSKMFYFFQTFEKFWKKGLGGGMKSQSDVRFEVLKSGFRTNDYINRCIRLGPDHFQHLLVKNNMFLFFLP